VAKLKWNPKRKRWHLRWRDVAGAQRNKYFATKEHGQADLARAITEEGKRRDQGKGNPDITLDLYVEKWLRVVKLDSTDSTHTIYESVLRNHVLPSLGSLRLRQLSKIRARDLFLSKLETNSRSYVRLMHCALHACLELAIEDGILTENPSRWPRSARRLTYTQRQKVALIKALDGPQRVQLEQAGFAGTKYGLLWMILGRTGMRISEACGLQWPDVDLENREIWLRRQWHRGRYKLLKDGEPRRIDLSYELTGALRTYKTEQARLAMSDGEPAPLLVFPGRDKVRPMIASTPQRVFKRMIRGMEDFPKITVHCLRHTYATLMLASGADPKYVQEQLGHSSIRLTVDTYGSWIPRKRRDYVDKMDQHVEDLRQMTILQFPTKK
jgi:integrase